MYVYRRVHACGIVVVLCSGLHGTFLGHGGCDVCARCLSLAFVWGSAFQLLWDLLFFFFLHAGVRRVLCFSLNDISSSPFFWQHGHFRTSYLFVVSCLTLVSARRGGSTSEESKLPTRLCKHVCRGLPFMCLVHARRMQVAPKKKTSRDVVHNSPGAWTERVFCIGVSAHAALPASTRHVSSQVLVEPEANKTPSS